ncbi:MAG: hypothetical protein JWQ35_1886 [Bacteriovoracaceae bacterium]|nr:hypothetical protein [Bacteriovoracaceae bacterium]
MTEPKNRRVHPRVDARVRVQFKSGKEFVACYSENLSKGGIYLQTSVPPDPNAVLEIVLDLPETLQSSSSQLLLRGRVIRLMSMVEDSKAIHKVAVQFVELTPQIQMQLDLLYEELLSQPA